ncbi:MAG: gamma carbonic anhydrase family protein [Oscillospiraceae bacterium]|nr:gamma carbonic anhydrase family protein [Oscillospiraceae bacterium]
MMNIHPSVTLFRGAVVSGDVTLGEGTSVWYNSVLRGDLAPIIVGRNCNIQENAVFHLDGGMPCILGDEVTVGHGAILHGCEIGDCTVIGMGSIILSGAKVGRNCIIGAGALVTGKAVIPDGYLAVGSPAKPVRPLTESEIERIRHNAEEYLLLQEKEKEAEVVFGNNP